MLKAEAQSIVEKLQKWFPKWAATDEEILGWCGDVLADLDAGRAMNAGRRLWMDTRSNTPRPREFLKHYQDLSDRAGQQATQDGGGFTGWFIQCVEGPRIGWYIPLCFGRDANIPQDGA